MEECLTGRDVHRGCRMGHAANVHDCTHALITSITCGMRCFERRQKHSKIAMLGLNHTRPQCPGRERCMESRNQ